MTKDEFRKNPVFVFDSGMGGITVLKALVHELPHENFLFFGDSAHSPYGTKSKEEVYTLTRNGVLYARSLHCKAVVIACNTATSAAAAPLREEFPDLPIIGLEPAIKPAVLYPYEFRSERKARILCMATALTLSEEKFLNLANMYRKEADIIPLPSPNLVPLIEQGEIGTDAMLNYLDHLLDPYKADRIDGIVLGCTHFPFARESIKKALGYPVLFFDGAGGAAREMKRRLLVQDLAAPDIQEGSVHFENSSPDKHRIMLEESLFLRPL